MRPINTLNAELNPICHLLALLGPHHILHVSRIGVKDSEVLDLQGFLLLIPYNIRHKDLTIFSTLAA
jgi:hypothetical protein